MESRRTPPTDLPFLDMSRADIAHRKKHDDEEELRLAERLQKREGQRPVIPGASIRRRLGPITASASSELSPDATTSQIMNFGRAILKTKQKIGRESKEHLPQFSRTLDSALGLHESRMICNEPVVPRRRTINEILARPTLPNPKDAHVSKVKEDQDSAKAGKDVKFLYTRVGIQPRHEVQSVTEVVPLLVPPTPSQDAMPSAGYTATQGSVVPLNRMERIIDPSNHHIAFRNSKVRIEPVNDSPSSHIAFRDSEVRFEATDNRTEARIAQATSIYRNSAFNFENYAQRGEENRPLTRNELRWLRYEILADLPAEDPVPIGDGDAVRVPSAHSSPFLFNTTTTTLMRIDGNENGVGNRAGLCQAISSQTHMLKSSSSVAQTDLLLEYVKWTQMPPQPTLTSIDVGKPGSKQLLTNEIRGTGADDEHDDHVPNLELRACLSLQDFINAPVELDEHQKQSLGKFMKHAMKVIMPALNGEPFVGFEVNAEEGQSRTLEDTLVFDMKKEKQDTFFTTVTCDGSYIAFVRSEKRNEKTWKLPRGYTTIEIWQADYPFTVFLHELRVWGTVEALDMCIAVDLVVAGSDNGALSVFSLQETKGGPIGVKGNVLLTPSFYTGSLEGPHHYSGITAVQILPETDFSAQVISMDSDIIICWSCVRSVKSELVAQFSPHSAPWTSIRFHLIEMIDLKSNILLKHPGFCYVSLRLWQDDQTHYVIGGNYGFSVKGVICPTKSGKKFHTHYFNEDYTSYSVRVPSLDVNCSRALYAACASDKVHVIYWNQDKVICSLKCEQRPFKVRWSRTRSSLFYVGLPNQVSVYDLLINDLLPIMTLPFKAMLDFDVLTYGEKEHLGIVFKNGKRFHVETIKCSILPLTSEEKSQFQYFIAIFC